MLVIGLALAFALLLWVSDIGVDFLDRYDRAHKARPFDWQRDTDLWRDAA